MVAAMAGNGSFKAHGEKDNLASLFLPGHLKRIERRVHNAHIRPMRLGLGQGSWLYDGQNLARAACRQRWRQWYLVEEQC